VTCTYKHKCLDFQFSASLPSEVQFLYYSFKLVLTLHILDTGNLSHTFFSRKLTMLNSLLPPKTNILFCGLSVFGWMELVCLTWLCGQMLEQPFSFLYQVPDWYKSKVLLWWFWTKSNENDKTVQIWNVKNVQD